MQPRPTTTDTSAVVEPIVITGFSFKLPQGAEDETSFWEVLENARNLMTPWPESRGNIPAFYDGPDPNNARPNTLYSKGAHFIREDPAAFDAPFFSITSKEAAAMDPQQRWLLETSYMALENAGIPVEKVAGTQTGVFAASMAEDYQRMMSRDPEQAPLNAATGTTASILANRVSWYFDLKGPSIQMNTACSTSLIAMDLACQSIRIGQSSQALVVGSNVLLSPEASILLSNMNFLSPDSKCYSFDERANGYARGEGVVALVLKKLSDAVRDGDTIRAVVRATGSNQDGHTPGLTNPSATSQEELIRKVYRDAGLGFEGTRYIEAHGTGTQAGDSTELKSIGRIFRSSRSAQEPLYVGSVKANLGHLEAASGLAGIIKSVMILEKGIIPPNALFEKLNPKINAKYYNIQIPTACIPWPTAGVRRISINSFGFGGSNGHIILDDAYHTLEALSVKGFTKTLVLPTAVTSNGTNGHTNGRGNGHANGNGHQVLPTPAHKLLVWSASDEAAVKRVLSQHTEFYETNVVNSPEKLDQLAFALGARRSNMTWRSFAVVSAEAKPEAATAISSSTPVRSSRQNTTVFVFTGQGAQYRGMGLELLHHPVFRETLEKTDQVFSSLGAKWSALDEIRHGERINQAEFSQPLCTALQIALVELLRTFNIHPAAVVGHSSGEIAAAYTIGALTLEAACTVAYHRGRLAGQLIASNAASGDSSKIGAMMSVNLAEADVDSYLQKVFSPEDLKDDLDIHVACVNSPGNVTLSGSSELLDKLKVSLDSDSIFAVKLRTGIAYHSPAMEAMAEDYLSSLPAVLESWSPQFPSADGESEAAPPLMISSVTGEKALSLSLSSPDYWVENLLSPVRFFDALQYLELFASKLDGLKLPITDYIEIGPTGALKRPIADSLASIHSSSSTGKATSKRQTSQASPYVSVLSKHLSPSQTILQLAGHLFCRGHPVSIPPSNNHACQESWSVPRITLPEYPFDHSPQNHYWHETRLSREWRLRPAIPSKMLGHPVTDFNPLEPRYRKVLSVQETPWIADHVVGKTIFYPATGTMTMAIEAVKVQASNETNGKKTISGYLIKEATFLNPIVIRAKSSSSTSSPDTNNNNNTAEQGGEEEEEEEEEETAIQGKTEVITQLRPLQQAAYEKTSFRFEVRVFSREFDDSSVSLSNQSRWTECFRSVIHVEYEEDSSSETEVGGGLEKLKTQQNFLSAYEHATEVCKDKVSKEDFYKWHRDGGLNYGPSFALADEIYWNEDEHLGIATVDTAEYDGGVIHPAVMDALCQVCFVAPSEGMTGTLPTIIPYKLYDTWVKASGWQKPATERVRMMTRSKVRDGSGGLECSFTAFADDGTALYHARRLDMLPIVGSNDQKGSGDEEADRRLIHSVQWKPHLPLLSRERVASYCEGSEIVDQEDEGDDELNLLENALRGVIRHAISQLSYSDWSRASPHVKKYISWMESQLVPGESENDGPSLQELQASLSQLSSSQPGWDIFSTVGKNLLSLIRGQIKPSSLLPSPPQPLIDSFKVPASVSNQLASYLSLCAHHRPAQKILQVVDSQSDAARSLSFTNLILSTLQKIESTSGGISFSSFTHASSTPEFQDQARQRFTSRQQFSQVQERLAFTSLDEGLKEGEYDMIILAAESAPVETNLESVRRLLKAGGTLLILDSATPSSSSMAVPFVLGLQSSWWERQTETQRVLRTETEWDTLLRSSGFSGADLLVRDRKEETGCSVVISTAAVFVDQTNPSRKAWVVVNDQQTASAGELLHQLETRCSLQTEFVKFSDASLDGLNVAPEDIVIFLTDIDTASSPFLNNLSSTDFATTKQWIQNTKNLLWVTNADPSASAHAGTKDGFIRTLRTEYGATKKIISLSLEGTNQWEPVAAVVDSAFSPSGDNQEVEFTITRDNQILTPRIIEEPTLNRRLTSSITPQTVTQPWLPGPPLRLDVASRGSLETLRFIEDQESHAELYPEEVEIEAKTWGVNFRDMFIALGRLDENGFGSDCAGVVSRVGSAVTTVKPGDRVAMGTIGCMRTYPRADEFAVVKIPDSVSFEEACGVNNPGITAWYSLVEVARLQKGEKILIHAASGATGQVAVQVAQLVGAEVFVTVGFEHKKKLLMEEYGIPEDHIFYSRNTSFAKGIMRMTGGYGVDVVLNSLVGEGLRASWECVAPYGRFVEIGKADINANSALPMGCFAKNVSFCAVDLRHVALHRKDLGRRLLHKSMELAAEGKIRCPRPLHCYQINQVEDAFRFFQSGKNTGRIVISINPETVVPKHIIDRRDWKFDSNATYIVAGGLGGIGREILRWMANKGAKHLLVPSRSGPSSAAAAEVVAELSSQGVTISTPKCDVSDFSSLSRVVTQTQQTMPPIRGCINAAMALNDSIFDNMTHTQWSQTVNSKVASSQNLAEALSSSNLEFFLLLSSVSGVVGNGGQANYAAGCTFQDALARQRTLQQKRAISIDLGVMASIGVVSETEHLQSHFGGGGEPTFKHVTPGELFALLDLCCDPSHPIPLDKHQISIGLPTPVDSQQGSDMLDRPIFGRFSLPRGKVLSSSKEGSGGAVSSAVLFKAAKTQEEKAEVVVEALAKKLARALSIQVEDVDADKPLHAFGVDSLVAVELRNWMAKEFAADVPVFEIMGGRTVAAIGELVTLASQIR